MISGALAAFEMDPATDRVIFKMEGYPDLPLGWNGHLAAARKHVAIIVSKFRARLEGQDLSSLFRAFDFLNFQMQQCACQLVNQDSGLLDEIRLRLVTAWPQWKYTTEAVPIIEIRGYDDFFFPFELLPLLDAMAVEGFDNYAEAEMAFRRFLGFGAAVRRTVRETVVDADLEATPRLPLQLVTYVMSGAVSEETYFGELRDRIEVEGPWPGDTSEPADVVVKRRLIDALFNPVMKLSGVPRQSRSPVQIHHFACHVKTLNQTDTGYALVVGGPHYPKDVTLGDIRAGFIYRNQSMGRSDAPRSLVVANGCSSAQVDKETQQSFPTWFLGNHHRGFIGTETNIPDEDAAAFAQYFYRALLDGRSLGEAVVIARRRLLSERSSPLGLLYVMYGNPTIKVKLVHEESHCA